MKFNYLSLPLGNLWGRVHFFFFRKHEEERSLVGHTSSSLLRGSYGTPVDVLWEGTGLWFLFILMYKEQGRR